MAHLRTVVERVGRLVIIVAVLLVGATTPALARPTPASIANTLLPQDWRAIQALLTAEQQAYFKASQVSGNDLFGRNVAVSGDTVVVGAPQEDSSLVGVQSTATPVVNESATNAGAVYVFVRVGTTWTQQAYLKASQISADDAFGGSVAVDGDTIVVGATGEDSSLAGVQNSATPTVNESMDAGGAAYIFVRNGTTWSQQSYLKASQVDRGDAFGHPVAIQGDTVVVGNSFEDSSLAGVQNSATPTVDEGVLNAGAAYGYGRSGTLWSQQTYLKASQVSRGDRFGISVCVCARRHDVDPASVPESLAGIGG